MRFSKQESTALAAVLLIIPVLASPIPYSDNQIAARGHKTNKVVNGANTAVQVGSAASDVINTGTELWQAGKGAYDNVVHKNQKRKSGHSHTTTMKAPAKPAPAKPEPAKPAPAKPAPAKPEHVQTEPKTSKIDKIVNGANTAAQVGSAANDLVSTGDSLFNTAKSAWNDVFHHGQAPQDAAAAAPSSVPAPAYCK